MENASLAKPCLSGAHLSTRRMLLHLTSFLPVSLLASPPMPRPHALLRYRIQSEMFEMPFSARYMIVMLGVCSIYMGDPNPEGLL